MAYIRLTLLLCVICAVVAGSIYFFGNYPLGLVLTHSALCLFAYFLCAAVSIVLANWSLTRGRTFLHLLPYAVFSSLLVALYIGNGVSNYFWKAHLNLSLIYRMVGHYYALYSWSTVAVLLLLIAAIFSLIALLLHRGFGQAKGIFQPARHVFISMAIAAFLLLNFNTWYHSADRAQLETYIYGEMLLDLVREYTDAHNDYLADADVGMDAISLQQSREYVLPREATIDRNKKNIILVVVDCLRSDHLQLYGYSRNTMPFLSQYVEEHQGAWVDNMFSSCDESKCGIRSILTSQNFLGQNTNDARDDALHGILQENGYQINFLLSSDHAFGGLKRAYQPFDYYVDGVNFSQYPLNDDRGLVEVMKGWPEYNGSPNYFHFHLFSAHEAGIKYGRYLGQGVLGVKPGFLVKNPIAPQFDSKDGNKHQQGIDWLDNKIFQADLVLSELFRLLESKGFLQNSLVVLVGDHGQGLMEHGYRGHIKGLYNESLGVPLIMVERPQPNVNLQETTFGTQLDIAPTVLRAVNIPAPDSWAGHALQTKKKAVSISEHYIPDRSESFAKIVYNPNAGSLYKYMFQSSFRGLKESEYVFDLVEDPKEIQNLLADPVTHLNAKKLIKEWGLDRPGRNDRSDSPTS